jgi:hypothetical protein
MCVRPLTPTGKGGSLVSNPNERTIDIGLSGLVQTLSGDWQARPAGRLMKRILREHPHASFDEAIRLFRDAALEDPEVFDDVVAEVFKRHLSKIESVGKNPRKLP